MRFKSELLCLLLPLVSSRSLPAAVSSAPNYMPCVAGSPGVEQSMPFCNHTLPVDERVNDLISRLSQSELCAMLDDKMADVPSIGFHHYNWNTECLHGLGGICLTVGNETRCPTIFGAPPGLGATFNLTVAHELGRIISDEIRAYSNSGGHRSYQNRPIGVSAWGPNLNIYRDPRWGRNVEVPSEDPFHSGTYGVAYTKGLQDGPDPKYTKAIGALKHYTIYSVESTRGRSYFDVSAHDIEETYLPQFKAPVVEAGSLGYMCSYAALTNPDLIPDSGEASHAHSEPCCASKFFAQTKMRDEYGFEGYVQSDCGAVNNEAGGEHWASSPTDAAAKAMTHGMMNSNCGGGLVNHACDAVSSGLATQADLVARVTRSLTLLMRAGLFDPPELQQYTRIPFDTINSVSSQASALDAARQSLVLLKNPFHPATRKHILPLSPALNVALLGPHAFTQKELLGNYFEDGGVGTCAGFSCVPSLNASFTDAVVPAGAIVSRSVCNTTKCDALSEPIDVILRELDNVDAVVLAMGIDSTLEGEGSDRMDIRLPGRQSEVITAVVERVAAHKPVVLLLFNGGLVSIEEHKLENIGIINCFYPGQSGGQAVADAVFGSHNRFGKLPVTYYAYNYTQKTDFFDMNMTSQDGHSPGRSYKYLTDDSLALWPFGFGLSYTTFTMSNATAPTRVHVSPGKGSAQRTLAAEVTVTNTGDREGDEVVFLYHNPQESVAAWNADMVRDDPSPLKQLVDYKRITLGPAESQRVVFQVPQERLSVVDVHGTRHILPGEHRLVFSRGHGPELDVPLAVEVDRERGRRVVVSTMAGYVSDTGV